MNLRPDARPLIAHVLFRFDVGGLENGVVNLVNRLPPDKWRHAVIALDAVDPGFAARVTRSDVEFISIRKPPGHLLPLYPRLLGLFRALRPAIVHTRNLAALEAMVPAWLAGVPGRVHGEHGWDVQDIDGSNRRFRLVRRLYRPFVRHYVALSDQIAGYLAAGVGLRPEHLTRIYNGVDTVRFHPAADHGMPLHTRPLVIGTVGRMQKVKDQAALVHALAALSAARPAIADRLRLLIVGDGPQRAEVESLAASLGVADRLQVTGKRDDVPELMRQIDLFVLPSLSEGISNTVLEAMASGLPVIATRVGGNAELVVDGRTGALVPPATPAALAEAIGRYLDQPASLAAHGAAGRKRIEERFSLDRMVAAYDAMYEAQLAPRRSRAAMASEGR